MFELDLEEPDFEYEDFGPLACIDCGSEKVYWMNVEGKWVLYNDETDNKHFCNRR